MTFQLNGSLGAGRGPSRRQLLAGVGAGGLAFSLGARGVFAAGAENVLKIGFISPRTGALAGFGETDGYVLEVARKALAQGLTIGGKTYQVEILDRDTQSDPSRASQLAKTLINSDQVDLMLPISTPETINPVADACEAAGVPCLSTVMPWEAWYFGRGGKPGQPSPFKWSYHFGFGGGEFHKTYLSLWNSIETNKKVGVLYPNDADGNAIRENLAPGLAKAGFTIIDPGPYEDGTTDYSAQIATFKKEKCEIFNTFPIPPDFAAFWRQAAQQGYTKMVKIAQIAKTGLFASQVDAVGPLGYNLASGEYWGPTWPYRSSLTGVSSAALGAGYTKKSGRYPNQQLGASLALFDVAAAALKASGNPKNKAAVANALKSLKVQTPVGTLHWGANAKATGANVVSTPILGNQWRKAPKGSRFNLELVVCGHADDKNVPVQSKLVSYS